MRCGLVAGHNHLLLDYWEHLLACEYIFPNSFLCASLVASFKASCQFYVTSRNTPIWEQRADTSVDYLEEGVHENLSHTLTFTLTGFIPVIILPGVGASLGKSVKISIYTLVHVVFLHHSNCLFILSSTWAARRSLFLSWFSFLSPGASLQPVEADGPHPEARSAWTSHLLKWSFSFFSYAFLCYDHINWPVMWSGGF